MRRESKYRGASCVKRFLIWPYGSILPGVKAIFRHYGIFFRYQTEIHRMQRIGGNYVLFERRNAHHLLKDAQFAQTEVFAVVVVHDLEDRRPVPRKH